MHNMRVLTVHDEPPRTFGTEHVHASRAQVPQKITFDIGPACMEHLIEKRSLSGAGQTWRMRIACPGETEHRVIHGEIDIFGETLDDAEYF